MVSFCQMVSFVLLAQQNTKRNRLNKQCPSQHASLAEKEAIRKAEIDVLKTETNHNIHIDHHSTSDSNHYLLSSRRQWMSTTMKVSGAISAICVSSIQKSYAAVSSLDKTDQTSTVCGTTSDSTSVVNMKLVKDPTTGISALVYMPPITRQPSLISQSPVSSTTTLQKLPVLVVLHGAGKNEETAWSLADPNGEHAGLAPSLLMVRRAPSVLANNFIVIAPYSYGKRSFYDEPRSKLLQFIEWCTTQTTQLPAPPPTNSVGETSASSNNANCLPPGTGFVADTERIFLFGFSEGAVLAVELATTRRFRAVVAAAYGYTGILPPLARERLRGVPTWIFHSADDAIYPVSCSDNLIQTLRDVNNEQKEDDYCDKIADPKYWAKMEKNRNKLIRYTRFDKDPEGFTGPVQGHSTGITASKLPQIYEWMLFMT